MLHNEKGLSLVEVMAASVILMFVVFTFANLSDYSFLAEKKSSRESDALLLAEQELNRVKQYAREFQDLPPAPSPALDAQGFSTKLQAAAWTTDPIHYNMQSVQSNHLSLQSVTLVKQVPYLITVTVSWGN